MKDTWAQDLRLMAQAGLSLEPRALGLLHQLPHHVRQDAAMAECDQFLRRIDTRDGLELDRLLDVVNARSSGPHRDQPARLQSIGEAENLDLFTAGEPERRSRLAVRK